MSRPAAIRPISDRAENYVKIMLYGEPGSGKSVMAGTSPNALILCNNSDETSSAAAAGSKSLQWQVNDYNDLTEAFEWIRHEGIEKEGLKWIWIDNGTLFQEQGMDQIMADMVMRRPDRSIFKPDKPEYGENQQRLSKIIRDFKSLPVNFGITAHVMRMDDDDKIVHMPAFQGGQGAFSQKICGYMGVVAYMKTVVVSGEKIRRIYLDKTGTYYAKDRYASTPKGRMDKPTIPKFMAGVEAKFPNLGAAPKPAVRTVKKAAKKSTTTRRSAT